MTSKKVETFAFVSIDCPQLIRSRGRVAQLLWKRQLERELEEHRTIPIADKVECTRAFGLLRKDVKDAMQSKIGSIAFSGLTNLKEHSFPIKVPVQYTR